MIVEKLWPMLEYKSKGKIQGHKVTYLDVLLSVERLH